MRTIEWIEETNKVRMIDQRLLPARFEYLTVNNADQMARAIHEMGNPRRSGIRCWQGRLP